MVRIFLAAMLLAPAPALAADIAVTVLNVANSDGKVLVAVCTPDTFLGAHCPYTASAPAARGAVTVIVRNVPPGTYAVQSFHDANDNLDLDRNFIGFPQEGMGFSHDAPMKYGPPSFDDAAIAVAAAPVALRLSLRYF